MRAAMVGIGALVVAAVLLGLRMPGGSPALTTAREVGSGGSLLSLPRAGIEDEIAPTSAAPASPPAAPPTACEVDPAANRSEARATRMALLAHLAARADERVRAAGLVLQAHFAVMDQQHEPIGECASPPCWVPEPSPRREAREALVRMALSTREPFVYAMAVDICRDTRLREDGGCRLLSTENLTRLDPGNAYRWLFVAEAAQQRGDSAAVAEAMHRIALAERSDPGFAQLYAIVAPWLPTDLPLLDQAELDAFVLTATVAHPIGSYLSVTRHCGEVELHDVNRRQTCDRIARVLTERGSSLLDLVAGLSMARRLNWPPERVEALTRQRDAYHELGREEAAADAERGTCGGLRRSGVRLAEIGGEGELAWLKRRMAESGASVDVYAERHRGSRRAATEAERAAASGPEASAAPASK